MQRRAPRTLNFTKAGIEALAPPAKRREYHYDQKVPGLAVAVSPAGGKVFYVVRRVRRRVEFIRIGGWPEFTVEQARNEAARVNGSLASGINPAEERRHSRSAMTLRAAFDAYQLLPTRTKSKRPKSAKTKHDYKLLFEAHLAPWSERPLTDITRHEIESLHNRVAGGSGHYTANRALGLLRSIYNAALDSEIQAGNVTANPAARIREFQEESRDRFLRAEELPQFWQALGAEPSEKSRDVILLALLTGQRKSNVAAMRWEQINFHAALWTLPHTKTGKHKAPLSAEAIAVLKRRKKSSNSEWVFPAHHGGGHVKDVYRAWRSILKRSGIKDLRMHDLRRTLGSWQTMTGASRAIVGKLLGHQREETTAIYGRMDLEPVRESVKAATAAMMKAAKKRPTS
jgi:integrase